jgi:thiol-disulfide isomerase/thioredoxin
MENWKGIGAAILLIVLLVGWYWYKQPKFVMGEQAPDFTFQTISSETKRLADFRGKYVLLHFWGSWCGPCRAENPEIVHLYERFKGSSFQDGFGLEIISIGMESSPEAWRKAILKDGLIWMNHSTDLRRLDGLIAKQYKVTEIPTTYLLDPKGVIIGVNVQPDMIEKALMSRENK